ncbi:MAG: DUF5655 domain-containing protein [Allosphingosinicella sp.]
METAEFFARQPRALAIHQAVQNAVSDIGEAVIRVSKSQVGFYRKHPFAATWKPKQYLGRDDPPLVLSVYLGRRDDSPRWKEIGEPAKGRFTHHVELRSIDEVDDFVRTRLEEAWLDADSVR